jgi:hypothetical protein
MIFASHKKNPYEKMIPVEVTLMSRTEMGWVFNEDNEIERESGMTLYFLSRQKKV